MKYLGEEADYIVFEDLNQVDIVLRVAKSEADEPVGPSDNEDEVMKKIREKPELEKWFVSFSSKEVCMTCCVPNSSTTQIDCTSGDKKLKVYLMPKASGTDMQQLLKNLIKQEDNDEELWKKYYWIWERALSQLVDALASAQKTIGFRHGDLNYRNLFLSHSEPNVEIRIFDYGASEIEYENRSAEDFCNYLNDLLKFECPDEKRCDDMQQRMRGSEMVMRLKNGVCKSPDSSEWHIDAKEQIDPSTFQLVRCSILKASAHCGVVAKAINKNIFCA